MISKKEAVTLGMLAIGGVGAAMVIGGGGGDGDTGPKTGALRGVRGRAGGVLGSQQGYGAPVVYNLPAASAVTFPKAPTFDINKLLAPVTHTPEVVSRGAAGVSSAGKKRPVQPYIYTGGEVKTGAVSVAPWAMGVSTPAEMGVTSALKRARGGGGSTSSKKSFVSAKVGRKARATARHTAARKKRIASKKENK